MNFSTATNFPPSFARVLTQYGKSLFKAWATPANATLAAPSIFPQASRDSRDHVQWQKIRFYSPVSVLLIMVLHSQAKLGSGIICSCSMSWKASIWLLISWLENTQSLNSACYPHGCGIPELLHLKLLSGISSFRMITWSLKENKTAEKKDSLSSEWTNIDLWYDRKSNSMVSSQKWPPQFVPQYICHISGPSQAGPLQSTELRPPGP